MKALYSGKRLKISKQHSALSNQPEKSKIKARSEANSPQFETDST
jgi:hypothetical protein